MISSWWIAVRLRFMLIMMLILEVSSILLCILIWVCGRMFRHVNMILLRISKMVVLLIRRESIMLMFVLGCQLLMVNRS